MKNLDKIIKEIFDADNLDHELNDKNTEKIEKLIAKHGWNNIFNSINDYLHKQVHNRKEVINFTRNYANLDLDDKWIPEPYKFLSYILFIYDRKDEKWVSFFDDAFECIYVGTLLKANIMNDRNMFEMNHLFDKKIIEEINRLKKINNKKKK